MREVFIGWDPRDDLAARVCAASIRRHASKPVTIRFLRAHELRRQGLYRRAYRVEESGQMVDEIDGRPFSTQFAFTRFLVPHLAATDFPLFVDADFMFRADVHALFELAETRRASQTPGFKVQVVAQDHAPEDGIKMDGVSQTSYPRKNWSSLMIFNRPRWRLGVEDVNVKTGRDLHGFAGIDDACIGHLPFGWNWLADRAGEMRRLGIPALAVHYTTGTPDMIGNAAPFSDEWFSYLEAGV